MKPEAGTEITADELDALFERAKVKMPKQKAFVVAYLENGYIAAEASRQAGYESKDHKIIGWQLLQKDNIKEAIKLVSEAMNKRLTIKPEFVLRKIIRGVEKAEKDNNLTAMFKGLDMLAKHLGMFSEKVEITGKDGKAIEIEQRNKEDVEAFKSTMASLARRGGAKSVPSDTE